MRRFLLAGSLAMLMMGAAAPLAPAHTPDRSGESGQALQVVGLTADSRLVTFTSERPSSVSGIGEVAGLKGDHSLVGVDYRILADGERSGSSARVVDCSWFGGQYRCGLATPECGAVLCENSHDVQQRR